MKLKSLRLVLLLALVLAAVAPVYGQDDNAIVVIPPGGTIKIAVATDLTNAIPEFGLDIAQGVQTAAAILNEAGGIKGFEVEIFVEDDRCSGDDATTVANRLASDLQVVAVVGHICSGATVAASDIYEAVGIVMVSPSATAAAVTARNLSIVNRVAPLDAIQGRIDAYTIYEYLGARKLAILHDNDTYGLGLAEVVRDEFTKMGGEVVAFEGINTEDQDYRPVLTPFAALEPDVIFFGGYSQQAVLLIPQKNDVGLEDTIFFGADGIFGQATIDGSGDSSEDLYATSSLDSIPEWDAKYEELFGINPYDDFLGPYHHHSADAAGLIFAGIEQVSEIDSAGNLVIDRQALIAAVRSTENYEGLTGTLTCNAIGDCGSNVFRVYVVEDGRWNQVELDIPAELFVLDTETE